jgi:hypothetical protein
VDADRSVGGRGDVRFLGNGTGPSNAGVAAPAAASRSSIACGAAAACPGEAIRYVFGELALSIHHGQHICGQPLSYGWRGFFRLTGRKRCGPGDRSGCERQISKTANQAAEREDSHDWNDRLSGRRNHQRRRSRLCTIVEIDPAHGSDSSHGLRQRYGARKPSARAFGIYFGQQLTREIAAWRSGRAVFAMKFA